MCKTIISTLNSSPSALTGENPRIKASAAPRLLIPSNLSPVKALGSEFNVYLSTGQSKIGRWQPIKLDNHCVFISQQISTNKISLERYFPYLNVDCKVTNFRPVPIFVLLT